MTRHNSARAKKNDVDHGDADRGAASVASRVAKGVTRRKERRVAIEEGDDDDDARRFL